MVVRRPLSDEESVIMGDALASVERCVGRNDTVATHSDCCRCHRDAHCAAGMQRNRGDGCNQLDSPHFPLMFAGCMLHMVHRLSSYRTL